MGKNLIFIVAYNHEHFIEKVVARIPNQLLVDSKNEVLIIDDGSGDQTFLTSDRLRSLWTYSAKLTVLRNPVNLGYGGNQKIGYRYAIDHHYDRVFLVHGDGQYAPELLPTLLAEYENPNLPDAVFGTRMANWRSPLKGGMPVYKFFGNKILTTIQNALLRSKLSEFHSGYRSYSTSLLKQIPFELNSNDFHFDTEIIIQAVAIGAKIVEVSILTHYGDEVCHVNGFDYAKNVVLSCLHYRVQQLGFLYDRKFDMTMAGAESYPTKESPYSSHVKLVELIPAGSKVLDLGCGVGHVAERLIKKGCIVDGVDIIAASEVQAKLRRYHQIDIHANMNEISEILHAEDYDYILLADIVEHLLMPENLLDLIRAAHQSRKYPEVLASTGNVAFFIVRTMLMLGSFNYGKRGILDRTHTRLFTKKSFRWMFLQCGYQIMQKPMGLPLPWSAVTTRSSSFVVVLEKVSNFLARHWISMFAYQIIIQARPLPTTQQLLVETERHSSALRHSQPDQHFHF